MTATIVLNGPWGSAQRSRICFGLEKCLGSPIREPDGRISHFGIPFGADASLNHKSRGP
jgi:hypothetical protein